MFISWLLAVHSYAQDNPSCPLAHCKDNQQTQELSVTQQPLQACSSNPLTGFFRDSYCRTGPSDVGFHVVCAEVNEAFLQYTQSMGNDLSTPNLRYNFPGLKPGDRWCLCATRWKQAKDAGFPTTVILPATNIKALRTLNKEELSIRATSPK